MKSCKPQMFTEWENGLTKKFKELEKDLTTGSPLYVAEYPKEKGKYQLMHPDLMRGLDAIIKLLTVYMGNMIGLVGHLHGKKEARKYLEKALKSVNKLISEKQFFMGVIADFTPFTENEIKKMCEEIAATTSGHKEAEEATK